MAALAVLLWRRLPAVPIPAVPPRWRDLIGSMLGMLRRDRTLRERGPLALLLFAGLNVFWAAAPLPLSAPPLHWSTAAIGALGLAGVVVALMAARVGHWMDRGFAHRVSLGALLLMLVAWWPLLGLPRSLSLLLLGVVVLDLGGVHSMSRTGHCCCVHRQNSMGAWWRYTCCSMQLAVGRVRLRGLGCRPGMAGQQCACWAPASRCWRCCGGQHGGWWRSTHRLAREPVESTVGRVDCQSTALRPACENPALRAIVDQRSTLPVLSSSLQCTPPRGFLQVRAGHHHAVAAAALGLVHRRVCACHQPLVVRMTIVTGHADAGGQLQHWPLASATGDCAICRRRLSAITVACDSLAATSTTTNSSPP